MGYGDEIMATGFARNARARGKRIAFGDPRTRHQDWTQYSEAIFRGNPNIAQRGQETAPDVEWHPFCRGNRLYNKQHPTDQRWIWNMDFRAPRGEVFLQPHEIAYGDSVGRGFVLIEPNTPRWKMVAPNKQWPLVRFQRLGDMLKKAGFDVVQLVYGQPNRIPAARQVPTKDFRLAMSVIRRAAVVVTPEGGVHHAAAAFNVPAVVIFGSFIPPQVTGYDDHINIGTGGAYCGKFDYCEHCVRSMDSITLEQVAEPTFKILDELQGNGLFKYEPPTLPAAQQPARTISWR